MGMIRSISHHDCRLTTLVFQPSTILLINSAAVDSTPFLVVFLTYVKYFFEQQDKHAARLKVNWRQYLNRLLIQISLLK